MSDFINALEAEITDLERQLDAHPLYIKLREARRLLGLYRSSGNTARTFEIGNASRFSARGERARPTSGAAAAVYSAVSSYLEDRTQPTPIAELMDMLAAHGIEPGGTIPRNTVSSLLSRYKNVFVSHGRSGWTLAREADQTEKAGDDAPGKDASPAPVSTSTPVEPGEEVAHDNTLDVFR